VRLLLPPSEAKSAGGRGRALNRRPAAHELDQPRRELRAALARLLAGDAQAAAQALLLPAGVAAAALAANAAVESSPTTAALRRYAGVVYDGLDFSARTPNAARLAGRSVLIFSGLFGVVRGDEPVPNYRVPAKAALPGIGVLSSFWRPMLDATLPAQLGRGLVVDLRSSDYAAMWRPASELAPRVLTVRVLSPRPGGGLGVLSYPSKFAKGQLAAALLERAAAGQPVTDVEHVAAAWSDYTASSYRVVSANQLELYADSSRL
jgi:cytoplasmic iron level regulating protein YaaA (DUF328/UPF0246 family)